jgi:hypothetical protein
VSLADSNTYLLFIFFLLTNAKFLLFVSFPVMKRTQKGMLPLLALLILLLPMTRLLKRLLR